MNQFLNKFLILPKGPDGFGFSLLNSDHLVYYIYPTFNNNYNI